MRVGNDDKTSRGGNGIGIYYLNSFNREDIGKDLFGYTKQFDGFSIILNTILSGRTGNGDELGNYIQAFSNDGTKQINPVASTKGDDVKNCLR
jgi:hypothetical protein